MNRHLGDIPRTRGRGVVRVERKIRRRTAEEVRGLGVTAVGDGLFRMGGPLSGADVLRILTTPKPKTRVATKPEISAGTTTPGATRPESSVVLSTGALADDVCRHIWTERGRFAPILYGSR